MTAWPGTPGGHHPEGKAQAVWHCVDRVDALHPPRPRPMVERSRSTQKMFTRQQRVPSRGIESRAMGGQSESVAGLGEFELIRRLVGIVSDANQFATDDDCAVIPLAGGRSLLATVDMLVQDVHFRLDTQDAFTIGRRAIAINVSDIAAMGGEPHACLVSLALPPTTLVATVEAMYRGMREETSRSHVRVAGGNVTRTPGPLAIDVTMLGFVASEHVVWRRGARPDDLLAVTGSLGGAAALRLAQEAGLDAALSAPLLDLAVPAPRVTEGRALAAAGRAHAMLDLSDGLAGDLAHLCDASGVGAGIVAEALPIRPAVRRVAAAVDRDPIALALVGGEDYELLVALPPDRYEVAARTIHPTPLTVIGRCQAATAGIELERGGIRAPLTPRAWRHF